MCLAVLGPSRQPVWLQPSVRREEGWGERSGKSCRGQILEARGPWASPLGQKEAIGGVLREDRSDLVLMGSLQLPIENRQ